MGLRDLTPNDAPGWLQLLENQADKRDIDVHVRYRGQQNPVFFVSECDVVGKIHLHGRPDRSDNRLWVGFKEEWDWITQQPSEHVLSVRLDIDKSNPSVRDFDPDRDNFIVINDDIIRTETGESGTMNIYERSFSYGRYDPEALDPHVNNWDSIFDFCTEM